VGAQAVLEGELLQFSVSATDPDGDGIVLWTNSLPQGSTFDIITGTFLWMPDSSQSGNYTVVFYATDDGTPNLTGQIEVVITVGDVPTPAELADQLVNSVVGLGFDKEIENSYLANLKKVNKFMEIGNVTAAINQIDAFIQKIEQDIVAGNISEIEGNGLIDAAKFLKSQLTDPLTWPLPGSPNDREITLNFGADWLVSCGGLIKKHTGIDVFVEVGEYVYAAYDVEVKAIVDGRQDGWAYAVTIEHMRGNEVFTTVCWHVDPLVGYGTVRKGQKIGTVADLGSNTHLHFGVRLDEYSNVSNRGALPQTECDGDPAFPEKFVNPGLLTYEK
jgi:murein DD-endopeptidase MepM/ murein hydrolase activator NlpD